MCGTNNHGDSAADIAEGIKAICSLIRDKQPQAYLVVLVRMDLIQIQLEMFYKIINSQSIFALYLRHYPFNSIQVQGYSGDLAVGLG